jgi:disulfide bond formation protein DsbB
MLSENEDGVAASFRASPNDRAASAWAWAALVLSLIATAGSLYLSMGLKLKACPLCFYQRTFAMAVFAVLAVGLVGDRARAGFLCLLTLPLALGGLGVAVFHERLVLTGVLECPPALLGLGSAPAQSLTIFGLLTLAIACGAWASRHQLAMPGILTVCGAALLGLVLAWGCVVSSPPLPAAPKQAYDPVKQPLDMCRPPYRGE